MPVPGSSVATVISTMPPLRPSFCCPPELSPSLTLTTTTETAPRSFLRRSSRFFTSSVHCDPSSEYPYFWGYAEEIGKGQAAGTNHNEPLPKGAGKREYLASLDRILAKVRNFRPSYLIISAGFDTHRDDPIGGLGLDSADYPEIGAAFAAMDLPTLILQEGGYNTSTLGDCVRNFLTGFLDAHRNSR